MHLHAILLTRAHIEWQPAIAARSIAAMRSAHIIVLALALAPAAALVPPAGQRLAATVRHAEDDPARAARRAFVGGG